MGLKLGTFYGGVPKEVCKDLEKRSAILVQNYNRTQRRVKPSDQSHYDATTTLLPRSQPTMEPTRPEEVDAETLQSLKDDGLYIFRDFLHLGDHIGHGHFGRVHRAVLYMPLPTEVAVKTLCEEHNEHRRRSVATTFLTEGLAMRFFDHPHVLGLVGISFHLDGLPMVVTPYMRNGDLLTYIRREDRLLTVDDLVDFGAQVADGMNYLSARKYVHRDLAARNCLLDDTLVVKIADFGLARELYEKSYYLCQNKASLPVRWMAPENLRTFIYTIQSDVWSFGVLLWELMTRGAFPYVDVESWAILRYLVAGHRLPQPASCPDDVYATMRNCWSEDPESRPSFEELALFCHRFSKKEGLVQQTVRSLPDECFVTYLSPIIAEESGASSKKTIVSETLL